MNMPPMRTRAFERSRWIAHCLLAPVLVAILAAAPTLCAQTPQLADGTVQRPTPRPSTTPAVDADSVAVSPDSPRASLKAFLDFSRTGDFKNAARYLDLTGATDAEGSILARRLKLVLDRYVWIDLDDVSPGAEGDTTDNLPAGVDIVATVRAPGGLVAPIRMRRATLAVPADPDATITWEFSRATVERIPTLYATLGNRWLIDRLPAPLLRSGPFELRWWQWVAVIPLLLLAAAGGAVGARIVRAIIGIATRRTTTPWDDAVLAQLAGPLALMGTLIAAALLVPTLELNEPATARVFRVLRVGYVLAFFWAAWRMADVGRQVLSTSRWARTMPASRSLVPLGSRIVKVLVAAVGLVTIFSTLGYPVASLLAGLGIGGLALALAAQKTVENLFGAFSIGVDQPFREGDFVRVDDFVGTVEAIGLRSTRFRTLDRTIVTLPNGRLADMRLESFTERDRLRLATTIGVVYETTAAQMRDVLAGCERVLRAHPKIWPDVVIVKFSGLGSSSLDIDIMAWFLTSDWGEFQGIRQEVLLQFMEVVERAGTSFAFPSTTVYLAGGASAAGATAADRPDVTRSG